MTAISLQSLLTPQKIVEVEYPGYDGFKLKIAFLSRDEVVKLRKRCTTTEFNKRTRQPEDKFDADLFVSTYIKTVLKGWSGLKFEYLKDFILIEEAGLDLTAELEFSEENAITLVKNCADIDDFITDVTSSLVNFTKYSTKG